MAQRKRCWLARLTKAQRAHLREQVARRGGWVSLRRFRSLRAWQRSTPDAVCAECEQIAQRLRIEPIDR